MDTSSAAPEPTLRRRPRWLVPAAGVAVVGGAVALALFQPWLLFVDQQVDETLPEVLSAPPAGDDGAGGAGSGDADTGDAGAGGQSFLDRKQAELDAIAEASQDAGATDAPPTSETAPAGPVVLSTGEFVSRGRYTTTGTVSVVELEDGSRVLTIEDLATDNGPDLFVYLDDSRADAPTGDFDDGVSLGRLRGNVGNLVYEIPADLDLDRLVSVGIWCDRFSSLFGAADLVPTA